jgi:phosphatidylserine decarboxylase
LTRLVNRLTRIRTKSFKNFLIRHFINVYDVNVEEILLPVPDGFASFNDFFIRELQPNERPVDSGEHVIVSPADGTVSAAGRIQKDRIFQAKGLHYTLTDLLATDLADAVRYTDGAFATIYLAPYNYHRVHCPLSGKLVAARYVPGDLYSVNSATVSLLPNLFARNERLVCHFETSTGPMVVILVGAMNVGSISTIWTGEIRPRKRGVAEDIDVRSVEADAVVEKGDLLGWFNMGSTVILLLPPATGDGFPSLASGKKVRMGEAIGSLALTASSPAP